MTEKLQQTIKDEVLQLSKETQNAIASIDWVKLTEEIGKGYLLDGDETTNLQLETLLVLIGTTDPELYAINIENQVGTTTDIANKIAEEVFEKIFNPINNVLLENIKSKLNTKNPTPTQTLDFILSGGDYTSFMEEK